MDAIHPAPNRWAKPSDHSTSTEVTRRFLPHGVSFAQAMMTKEELAFEQQKMRERWKTHSSKDRSNQSRPVLPARVGIPPMWEATPAKRSPRRPKSSLQRSLHEERFALGFSLGVPPVRAGYCTAEIQYACVCGAFSTDAKKCLKCGRKRSARSEQS
jgi:hypothetical protein